ncbi:MAG: orotate phosphoribosyltransferase [Proteobacteria bacterium]|nr:orotate phosphoribosyltransferase [Pseudomonadota bacterium]
MQPYQTTFIELAIRHQALRFGQFTLKSGRLSPYFFNVGQLNTGEALKVLGECYAKAMIQSGLQFDMLFGPAYKGIPLVCATSLALSNTGLDVPYCFNRKETKDHGEGGQIIGSPLKGRVIIVDDVITAGTALREALKLIQTTSASISGIIVALDRQEKGLSNVSAITEFQSEFNIPVKAIMTFADILSYVKNNAQFKDYAQDLANYREQYGII